MSAPETLLRVAALLTPEDRERFLQIAARSRNLPEDDEYLQILEAIGFMTLIWNKVPHEIQSILEVANPVAETCQSLKKHVFDAVNEAVPSHQDLSQITQSLKEHQLSLKQTISSIQQSSRTDSRPLLFILIFAMGCALGSVGDKAMRLFEVDPKRPYPSQQEK